MAPGLRSAIYSILRRKEGWICDLTNSARCAPPSSQCSRRFSPDHRNRQTLRQAFHDKQRRSERSLTGARAAGVVSTLRIALCPSHHHQIRTRGARNSTWLELAPMRLQGALPVVSSSDFWGVYLICCCNIGLPSWYSPHRPLCYQNPFIFRRLR
jgi:hypothetical protein